jgi:hypothetical protein
MKFSHSLISAFVVLGFSGLLLAIAGCTTPAPPKPPSPTSETQAPSPSENTPKGKSAQPRSAEDAKKVEKSSEPTLKTPESSSTPTKNQAETNTSRADTTPPTAESKAQVSPKTSGPGFDKAESADSTREQKNSQPASGVTTSTMQTGVSPSTHSSALPPPTSESSTAPSYKSLKSLGVKTVDEKTEAKERQLDESLNAFDDQLLREKRLLDEQRTGSGLAGEALGSGAEEGMETADHEGTASTARTQQGSTSEAGHIPPGRTTEGKRRRVGTASSPTPLPPDIPDAHDDDIVARQLREAAENEKDPALREKLWEEYRRYKSGKGS